MFRLDGTTARNSAVWYCDFEARISKRKEMKLKGLDPFSDENFPDIIGWPREQKSVGA